jgi:inhibitor of KinA sporulation pathway (predicted exonuclease)
LEQKLILSGAEKAAAKAAAPSLARTTAAAAAKYGVEGAIISAPQAITEAAFGDFNKSAEHLLAGVGGNIVLGGTVSGLGALGKGFYNLSKRAMRETALGQYISEGFSPEMAALSAAGLERGSARKLGKDKLDDIGNTLLTQPLMSDGKPVVSSGMSGKVFRDRVEAFKNESVEQMEKILTDLDAAREVKTSVGSVGNTEIKRKADELFSAGDFKSAVDLLKKEKIQIQKSKVFDLSFEDITKKLDELSEKYKYAIDTSERLAVSKVKRTVDAFAAEGKTSFKDFHNLKVKLGKNTQWSATDTKSLTQLKQDMYGVVNSELDKSINKVEELYGDEFAGVFKDFQTAKKGYAAATEVSRLLETEKARELGNKVFGLTDTILGSGGLAFGGAAFGAGGSFGALLLPILGVAGKKLLESTWFKTAYASGVKNIGENGAISLLTNAYKHSKEKINEGALIALGLAPMDVIKSVPKVATYKAISEFLGRDIHSELKQDRQKLAEELYTKLDKQTLDMSGTIDKTSSNADVLSYTGAPSVAQEFAKKQIEVLDYLKTVLPKIDKQYNLFEGKKSHEITDQDLHRFEKSLRILANPFSIIQSIQTNTITKDEIQALQAIYPNIYESFKNRIIQVASEKKPNLSFQDRMRLSILLGVPLDPSVGASGRYQASFGSATQSPPPGGSVRPSSLDVKPATLNTPVSNLMFKNK